ncbi:MAG TPA: hypothetical protein VF080_15055 [Solirubrobacteraceae bacterium]
MVWSVLGSSSRISREKWKVKKIGRKSSEVTATATSARRRGRDAARRRAQYTASVATVTTRPV